MNTPIIDNNALTASLRALKPAGMLQTLDARLAQARAGEPGHLEFLQVLSPRRDHPARDHRHHPPHPPGPIRADPHPGRVRLHHRPETPRPQIRDLAALRRLQAGESVILYGPVGSREDPHRASPRPPHHPRPAPRPDSPRPATALAHPAGGHADGSPTRRPRELARPAVLVLDGFAMRELNPTQADDLYELITQRSDRSLILTSNRHRWTGTRCSPTPSSPSPCSTA